MFVDCWYFQCQLKYSIFFISELRAKVQDGCKNLCTKKSSQATISERSRRRSRRSTDNLVLGFWWTWLWLLTHTNNTKYIEWTLCFIVQIIYFWHKQNLLRRLVFRQTPPPLLALKGKNGWVFFKWAFPKKANTKICVSCPWLATYMKKWLSHAQAHSSKLKLVMSTPRIFIFNCYKIAVTAVVTTQAVNIMLLFLFEGCSYMTLYIYPGRRWFWTFYACHLCFKLLLFIYV